MSSNGDFAQPLQGLSQQQTVNVSSLVQTAALKNVDKGGVQQNAATRSALNFIDGSNGSVTVADNSGSDRVDVTVGVVSSPTFTNVTATGVCTVGGYPALRHPYGNSELIQRGLAIVPGSSTAAVTFTAAFASTPIVVVSTNGGSGTSYWSTVSTSGVTVGNPMGTQQDITWFAFGDG